MSDYNSIESQTKKNVIYIYDPSQTESTNRFCDALCSQIKRTFGSVRFEHVGSSVVEGHCPLLVLCHNYSRIGTDIDSAMADITGVNSEHLAVLVVHTKALHALPITMPTENLVDEKYERMGRLMDFAFTADQGLYRCNMNVVGERKLTDFLDRYLDRSGSTNVISDVTDCLEKTCPCPTPMSHVFGRQWTRKKILILIVILLLIFLAVGVIIYLFEKDDSAPVHENKRDTLPLAAT